MEEICLGCIFSIAQIFTFALIYSLLLDINSNIAVPILTASFDNEDLIMKENYAIIILLITSISIFAQPTLNLANLPTTYSASVIPASPMENEASLDWVGPAGGNQIWDFSSFQILLCCDDKTITLVPLSFTPAGISFPDANYCYEIAYEDPMYDFWEYRKATPDALEILGINHNFGVSVYTTSLTMYNFPYEFNTEIQTNDPGSNELITSTYDAYGTLITPYNTETFTEVIRKKTIIADDPRTYYVWYNTNPYYILMEADVSAEDTFFRYYLTFASGSMGIDGNIKEAPLTVSPNPAKSILNLKIANNLLVDKIIITDLSGKVIAEKTENLGSIDVQNLANGVYIVSAYSGKEKFQTKFLKE